MMYELYFDGGANPNPGRAGAGAVVYKNNEEILCTSHFVGINQTNNEAEYTGLIKGFELALKNEIYDLTVKGDSQLVIKQMKGEYKVKAENLKILYSKAKELEGKFSSIIYLHVKREFNKRADQLATIGME